MSNIMITRHRARGLRLLPAVLLLVSGALAAQEATLVRATGVQETSDKNSIDAQRRISQLDSQISDLRGEYRMTVQQLDRIQIYNGHMQKVVNDQRSEIDRITNELENIVVVEQGIVPLMYDMIDTLEEFIELDMPFNVDERRNRVAQLRENMESSDLTISENFRQIMSAYQTETGFGKDMEATTGDLAIGGEPRNFNILRVGRILLAYQSKDREDTGFWNKTTRQWEPLDDEFRAAITEGLKIAGKQAAPNLLKLPVPAPENAQ